ncbi:uncharacterized protein [Bemisia tabaci]|uniref:uncharacterized protein n=1 Tax=Bemisia tabaci TaxID=7038 RepID=UPI003B28652C
MSRRILINLSRKDGVKGLIYLLFMLFSDERMASKEVRRKKEELIRKAEANEHDKMAVTLMKCSVLWRGKHTRDILIPQMTYPKIHVQIEDTTIMIYAYDYKLRNVTSGRTLKTMIPTDVYNIILPQLSQNNGLLFDGERYS